MSLTHALKWSLFSELAAKLIQPVVFIILARLLTPEDFGVMTAALMVIAFTQIFWEAGMSKVLIQRQSNIEESSNAAFWVNIGLGCIIAFALYFSAEPIARIFFHDERVIAVLQVMTINIFLGASSAVHTALLQKNMAFKKLFWIRFVTVGLPGLVSIPLAWNGMGYWALVVGTLTGQAMQVILLWQMSAWRPKWSVNIQTIKEMQAFGGWVIITGLTSWTWGWADTFIAGYYFSVHEVGLLRMGNQLSVTIFSLIFGFMIPVLYSKFSSVSNNLDLIREWLFKSFLFIPIISLPIGLIVFTFAKQIELFLFGEKWNGLAYVISLIALKESVLWVFGLDLEAYRAIGKPKYETFVSIMSAIINIAVLYFFSGGVFYRFVFGRAIVVAVLGFLLHFLVIIYVFRKLDKVFFKILVYILLFAVTVLTINSIEVHSIPDIFLRTGLVALFTLTLIYFELKFLKSVLYPK